MIAEKNIILIAKPKGERLFGGKKLIGNSKSYRGVRVRTGWKCVCVGGYLLSSDETATAERGESNSKTSVWETEGRLQSARGRMNGGRFLGTQRGCFTS